VDPGKSALTTGVLFIIACGKRQETPESRKLLYTGTVSVTKESLFINR
jgi:hypothetical protein